MGKPKIVHVISTRHSARMVNTAKLDGLGNIVKKPEAIVYYNKNTGGVARIDQQLDGIAMLEKTYKWNQKIFFYLVCFECLAARSFTCQGKSTGTQTHPS